MNDALLEAGLGPDGGEEVVHLAVEAARGVDLGDALRAGRGVGFEPGALVGGQAAREMRGDLLLGPFVVSVTHGRPPV